ncbi:hypothetical protein C8J56DRAFT_1057270 [Mycena floridula]|nr:hypothetical protein C8J56DRAFT_1057270 [Mycena floridula]
MPTPINPNDRLLCWFTLVIEGARVGVYKLESQRLQGQVSTRALLLDKRPTCINVKTGLNIVSNRVGAFGQRRHGSHNGTIGIELDEMQSYSYWRTYSRRSRKALHRRMSAAADIWEVPKATISRKIIMMPTGKPIMPFSAISDLDILPRLSASLFVTLDASSTSPRPASIAPTRKFLHDAYRKFPTPTMIYTKVRHPEEFKNDWAIDNARRCSRSDMGGGAGPNLKLLGGGGGLGGLGGLLSGLLAPVTGILGGLGLGGLLGGGGVGGLGGLL